MPHPRAVDEERTRNRRTRRAALACAGFSIGALLLMPGALLAQTSTPRAASPLSRWFELQTFTLYTRYRVVENSQDVVTSNQLQYKDAIRAKFNLDPRKRFTVNVGFFSGNSFISSWNNWGAGRVSFDGKNNYLKQMFASARVLDGVELQYGGLYVRRGEDDDITTYDEDGFLVGERVTIQPPRRLFVDEIVVSRGAIGPFAQPNLGKRWDGLSHPNYAQGLVAKRFGAKVAGSLDFTAQDQTRTIRAAITWRPPAGTRVSTVRYEQYRRTSFHAAAGFAAWAEIPLPLKSRFQAGYATIDQFYGGWNADRIQSGRRFFAIYNIPIRGPLSGQLFATQALDAPYPLSIKRRFDAVVSYDVLAALKDVGIL
jgi:hypothetical protein